MLVSSLIQVFCQLKKRGFCELYKATYIAISWDIYFLKTFLLKIIRFSSQLWVSENEKFLELLSFPFLSSSYRLFSFHSYLSILDPDGKEQKIYYKADEKGYQISYSSEFSLTYLSLDSFKILLFLLFQRTLWFSIQQRLGIGTFVIGIFTAKTKSH